MNNFLKVLLVCAVCIISFSAQGQTTFGARAGINLASISISGDGASFSYDRTLGITVGMLADISMSETFSMQPELNYIQKGYAAEIDFFGITEFDAKINYIELPVHAKYKFGGATTGGYLLAGPTFGYALSGNIETCENGDCFSESIEFDENDGFNRFEIGLSVGTGVVINQNIMIDLRYTLGLSNLSEDDFSDLKATNNGIQIGVGYLFGSSTAGGDEN